MWRRCLDALRQSQRIADQNGQRYQDFSWLDNICTVTRNEMASGLGSDAAEGGAALMDTPISTELDLTDISLNEFFSIPDDVGETLDREMHRSLFGDSGLGMELAPSLMAPSGDALMLDLAAQLFSDMPAAGDAQSLPEDGITAESGEGLLACFEEQVAPLSQSLSCPVSPNPLPAQPSLLKPHKRQLKQKRLVKPTLAPRGERTRPPPPKQPKPKPVPASLQRAADAAALEPTMATVRAGQSVLKPRVTADLRKLAATRVDASAPGSRHATPATSRPHSPTDASPRTPTHQARSLLKPQSQQPVIIKQGPGRPLLIKTSSQSLLKQALPSVVVTPWQKMSAPRQQATQPDAVLVARARPGRPAKKQLSRKHRERRRDLTTETSSVAVVPGSEASVGSVSSRSTCSETESVGEAAVQPEEVHQLRTQCELLVKHVRRTSQSTANGGEPTAGPPQAMEEDDEAGSIPEQASVADSISTHPSPLRPELWDHSYCSRGDSGASSPHIATTDASPLCKVPGYLTGHSEERPRSEPEEGEVEDTPPEPILLKVPEYVRDAPPQRKKLSLMEYRQRRSALNSRCATPPTTSSAAASPTPPADAAAAPPIVPSLVPTVPPPAPVAMRTPPHLAHMPALRVTPIPTQSAAPADTPLPESMPTIVRPPPMAGSPPHHGVVKPPPTGYPSHHGVAKPPPAGYPPHHAAVAMVPPPPPGSPPVAVLEGNVRQRPSSPPRGYRLTPTSKRRKIHRSGIRPRAASASDSDSSSSSGSSSSRSSSSSSSSSSEDGRPRYQSPEDPFRYRPGDFDNVSVPSTRRSPDRRRRRSGYSSGSRSRSPLSRHRSRSPLSRRRSRSPGRSRHSGRSRGRSPDRRRRSSAERRRREQRDRERERRKRVQEEADQKDAVDRKVVYVNGLSPNITREKLKEMFHGFGPITKIRIKEREQGCTLYREQRDGCYAFLTFSNQEAAVAAQTSGTARFPHLEVKFGGRREFCLDQYNDQDADLNNPAYYGMKAGAGGGAGGGGALDFDTLLQMEMQRIKQKH